MKKKLVIILLSVSVLLNVTFIGIKLFSNNDIEDGFNEPSQVKHEHMLSMMLETDSGSGEYSLEERSSWPTKEDGYVFNSKLSKCEKGSKLRWDDENNLVLMEGTTSDKCYVYFDIYNPSLGTIADWVVAQYTGTQGENNLYYHDSTLENGAGDNSYRYAGSSATTNNYVCFGSDANTCPNDNLYRIIGVFDGRVRIIKADYATRSLLGTDTSDYSGTYSLSTSYYQGDSSNLTNIAEYFWNSANFSVSKKATDHYNDWSYSELNKTHLNKNFLNNIGSTWANMIGTTTWKVGGFESTEVESSIIYTNEITNPSTQVTSTYESKVGLMYVSDYAFAASQSAWTTTPYKYDGNDASGNKITEENWMYMGLWEWTITRTTSYSGSAGRVFYLGSVHIDSDDDIIHTLALGVRPVFHLTSKIIVTSGDGTKENPYRLS